MSSNFDWRAEDDISWDEYSGPGSEGDPQDPRRKRPIWLIILVVAAVLLGSGYLAFRQVRSYVENTAESVEEDVLSSHALVKLAASEGDLELFAPLLSGRDPNWTQDQLEIMENDLLFDRQPFGLVWRPEETADDIAVTLSNDLQSAEVEYVETYGYGLNGEEGAVQLTQTAVYRLSETRWLLSPPEEDFWGDWVSSKGRHVVLTFPERDDEIGRRLASDLEATIAGACTALSLDCDASREPLDVLLETDLDAVMAANDPEYFARTGEQLVLPTPTLVGKPANNASYRALYRGYAAFIISRLIAQQADYDCCDQSPFFKAFVDVQLHQIGIQTWPLSRADYRQALRQPLNVEAVREIRNEELSVADLLTRPDWQTVYLFVEFVASQPDAPPIIELEQIMASTASFGAWTSRAGIQGSVNIVDENWQEAIHQKIASAQGELPEGVSWPEEDLALICVSGQSGLSNVYRYSPPQNSWTIELRERSFVVMSGLPANGGLILTEQYLDVDLLRTTIWQDGQEKVVAYGDNFYFSSGVSDPSNTRLVINSFDQATFSSENYLLNLENCEIDNCELTPIAGVPLWSSDGAWTLFKDQDSLLSPSVETEIFLGDGRLETAESIGSGFQYFWLDNENFVIVQGLPNPHLLKVNVESKFPEPLVDDSDLAFLLPEVAEVDLEISNAATDPTEPDLIFITAANRLENIDYIFTYNWRSGEKKLLFTIEDSPGGLQTPRFSPDHRWLVLQTLFGMSVSSNQRTSDLYLYNLETGENLFYSLTAEITVGGSGWTNNGQWLTFRGQGFLLLSNPAANYDHLVLHEFGDCTDAAWIRK